MFSKFSFLFLMFAAVLLVQVRAHAAITPVLGVKGAPQRNDAQKPSDNAECGKTNVAKNIDSSAFVTAGADGSFTMNITNFNGGIDGSRQVASAKVDATGVGKDFVSMNMTKNGDKNPDKTGTQQIAAQLPAGTKCTGGKTQDLCIASFKTAGGFGNCVVVKQAGAASSKACATRKARALRRELQLQARNDPLALH